MSANHSERPVPPAALGLAGVAILVSLGLAAYGRATGATESPPSGPVVASRTLLFKDQPNGAVAIFDATRPEAPISVLAPETNGFLRATMRGLARQRHRESAGAEVPFRLTQWADGRLILEDPTTGRRVEMEAFGASNEAVFARLLTAEGPG